MCSRCDRVSQDQIRFQSSLETRPYQLFVLQKMFWKHRHQNEVRRRKERKIDQSPNRLLDETLPIFVFVGHGRYIEEMKLNPKNSWITQRSKDDT